MSRAYRWSPAGLTWLGPDSEASNALDLTADGSVVLGTLLDSGDGFIATPEETRSFSGLLASAQAAAEIELEGWQPSAPLRFSNEGRVLFGFAQCGGQMTPYRWELPR